MVKLVPAKRSRALARKHDLTFDLIINSLATQLGLTRFEYRLLDFFDYYCVPLFSHGMNSKVNRVWKQEVPKLFLRSHLVRQAIFSFSSLNLWPICDVAEVMHSDNKVDQELIYDIGQENSSIFDCNLALVQDDDPSAAQENLYIKTTSFFMNTVAAKGDAIEAAHYDEYGKINDIDKAQELVVSGILIFAFLGMHPHQVVPLISFEENANDLLGVCKGIKSTSTTVFDALMTTAYRDLFNMNHLRPVYEITSEINLPRKLRKQLHEYYDLQQIFSDDVQEINADLNNDLTVLNDALNILEGSIDRCVVYNYPVPVFGWLLLAPQPFYDLVRRQNVMALRILFNFSLLCMYSRFKLYSQTNIWLDFVNWYVDEYKWTQPYADFDRKFYYCVVEKTALVRMGEFKSLGIFDPEIMYDQLRSQSC